LRVVGIVGVVSWLVLGTVSASETGEPGAGVRSDERDAGNAGSTGASAIPADGSSEVPEAFPAGRWTGTTEVAGVTLPFAIDLVVTDDGCSATMDIQGQIALPLEEVRCRDGRVHFELPAPIGRAVWDGRAEDGALVGTFQQNVASGTFRLSRGADADATGTGADDAEEAPPYRELEVAFDADAAMGVRLAATLTLPEGAGPHPAMVLITGSGPQDRDEQLFGFRPFRVLADALTRAGIAVLRYDERGVGGSTGDFAAATMYDLADDAEAALGWLRARPETDAGRVGILGHSEGGVIGPRIAARSADAVAFLVLLAPPTVDGETLLREQARAILQASGLPANLIEPQLAKQRRLFEAVRSGEGWDELEREGLAEARSLLATLPAEERARRMEAVETRIHAELAAARSPAYRVLLDHDPAPDLRGIRVPTLAVFGELDTQVPPHVCRGPLEDAFSVEGAGPLTVEVLDSANHLFQEAVTGAPTEYAALPKRFVDGFLETVVRWTAAVTGAGEPVASDGGAVPTAGGDGSAAGSAGSVAGAL
jgi:pimeloyl-ACP methyl ester carboxylesterase